jgi:hypothetical protein
MGMSMLVPLLAGESAEVFGLEAEETLAFAVQQRRVADQAAALELRAVTHWADLHRVDGVGAVDRSVFGALVGESRQGREAELRLAGEGAFAVEEFAVAELAAALGMSEAAGRAYVGQALEIRDRLPRLWQRVQTGTVPAWKARRVAEETIALNPECADYVDRHLAPFAARLSIRRILRVVHAAIARHDRALAQERAARSEESRGVWLGPVEDGLVTLTAVADAPDAAAFNTAVGQVAAALAALGDPDSEQVRRARAVGVLADPQYALDVHASATQPSSTARDANDAPTGGQSPGSPAPSTGSRPLGSGRVVHLHLHTDAVSGSLHAGEAGVARTPFGPETLATVERWLTGLAPGARVRVTPVVDLRERIAVDAYEVPDRLRRQVEERDLTCCFPWCGRQGGFDADHIEPYRPRAEGGPPGQTRSDGLARLCRFHHRIRTHPGRHGRWTYQRAPGGAYHWVSPLVRAYTVDGTGTHLSA